MRISKVTPTNHERPFYIEELFFSTTDPKGFILSGNEVFVRVSGYTREDLIAKPHNIIRHPDMPRAVFKLLWDYLHAGKTIAAYVKNMAADGGYYWVMALVVPTEEGYLSVRFKPSSPYFAVVRDLYTELLAIEKAQGDTPADHQEGMRLATEHLVQALQASGFENYDVFMQTALPAEILSRATQVAAGHGTAPISRKAPGERPPLNATVYRDLENTLLQCRTLHGFLDQLFTVVEALLGLEAKLKSKSTFLLDLSRHIRLLSLNALIQSSHLLDSGRALSVVADNMAAEATASTGLISKMTDTIGSLVTSLREMAFSITAMKLQVEVTMVFLRELLQAGRQESAEDGFTAQNAQMRSDVRTLTTSFIHSAERMTDWRVGMNQCVGALEGQVEQLVMALMTLACVHLSGRVEAAHVREATRFSLLFEEMFQRIRKAQDEMHDFGSTMSSLGQYNRRITQVEQPLMEAIRQIER